MRRQRGAAHIPARSSRTMKWSFEYSWGTRPVGQPWQSIGLAVVGIVCSAFAIYTYWTTSNFLKSSVETQGKVIELTKPKGGTTYSPVVKYYDADAAEHILRSSTGSNPPNFSVNERVTILYAPGKPSEAKIKEFWSLWLMTVVTGILGFGGLVAALLAWVYRKALYGQTTPRRR